MDLVKKQIGELIKGDLFKTALTNRMGVVVEPYDQPDAGIKVNLKDPEEIKSLHHEIRVIVAV